MAAMAEGMNRCSTCKSILPFSDFTKNKSRKNGLSSQCRSCCNAYAKARYHSDTARFNSGSRARYRANAETVARKAKEKYELNKSVILPALMAERRANRERWREIERRWVSKNRDSVYSKNRNYRARRKNSPGSHTAEDIKHIYHMQAGRCAYCKTTVGDDYDVDHIHPLALGGTNDRSNLQILCSSCNSKKGAKDPADYARSIGLLI